MGKLVSIEICLRTGEYNRYRYGVSIEKQVNRYTSFISNVEIFARSSSL